MVADTLTILDLRLSLFPLITCCALYLVFPSKFNLVAKKNRPESTLATLVIFSLRIILNVPRFSSPFILSQMTLAISVSLSRISYGSIIWVARWRPSSGGSKFCRPLSRSHKKEWEISSGDRYGLT